MTRATGINILTCNNEIGYATHYPIAMSTEHYFVVSKIFDKTDKPHSEYQPLIIFIWPHAKTQRHCAKTGRSVLLSVA